MRVSSVAFSELGDLAELWVELVADQRASDSHLQAEVNRTPIWEALVRHVTADGVLVVHEDNVNNGSTEVGGSVEDADTDGFVGLVMFDIEAGAYEQDMTRRVVRSLFVRPTYRDAGVETRLLTAAEDALTDAGVDAVALDMLADNEVARRSYRRRGYWPHRVGLEKSMRSDTHSKESG